MFTTASLSRSGTLNVFLRMWEPSFRDRIDAFEVRAIEGRVRFPSSFSASGKNYLSLPIEILAVLCVGRI